LQNEILVQEKVEQEKKGFLVKVFNSKLDELAAASKASREAA
jgi:hypothetical protein